MKTPALILTALSATLLLSGCGGPKPSQAQTATDDASAVAINHPDWQTSENEEYFIQYPADWTFNNDGPLGAKFFVFAPLDSDKDTFRENVNLNVENLQGHDMDLGQYIEIAIEQIGKIITNVHLTTNERIGTGDREYHKVIYTGSLGEYNLQWEQHVRLANGQAYILTFCAEPDQFDSYKNTWEDIAATFRLK